MNIIAVVPARGGSKRIKRKNIVEFNGQPLLAWTLKTALRCSSIKRVFVSTDDVEIARVARENGGEVPFMRETAEDDISPVSMATSSCLKKLLELNEVSQQDIVVQLMPNCPFRNLQTLDNAIERFLDKQPKSLITCSDFGWTDPNWSLSITSEGYANFEKPDNLKSRSQDLPSFYCPSGAVWISKIKTLLDTQTFWHPDTIMQRITWLEGYDIDTQQDLEIARLLCQGVSFE